MRERERFLGGCAGLSHRLLAVTPGTRPRLSSPRGHYVTWDGLGGGGEGSSPTMQLVTTSRFWCRLLQAACWFW